jgi:hypothetical protein
MRTWLSSRAKPKDQKFGDLVDDAHIVMATARNDIKKTANAYALLAEAIIDTGDAVHWFLPDKNFCNWIIGCVGQINNKHAGIISDCVGCVFDGCESVLCVHFPTSDKIPSCGVRIPKQTEFENGDKGPDYGIMILTYSRDNQLGLGNALVQIRCDNDLGFHHPHTAWMAKLIIGLGMYIECFPEQIADGIPFDLKHPNHFRKMQSKTISIAPSVFTNHNSPIPHYRTGHFRLLSSEYYKNKRWKVVFVSGCFVKGKAQTVLNLEETNTCRL